MGRLWPVVLVVLIRLMAASSSRAQCARPLDVDLHAERWIDITTPIPIPLAWVPSVGGIQIDICRPSVELGIFGLTVNYQGGNNAVQSAWDFELMGAIGDVTSVIDDELGVTTPGVYPTILTCTMRTREDLGHVSGGGHTYAYHIGGGGPYGQRVAGTIRFCEDFVIESSAPHGLELPVQLGATLLAAETFGDPDHTFGKARACVSGTVDGQPVVSGCDSVESTDLFPTQRSISSASAVFINAPAGRITVPVRLTAEVETVSQAKSTGLFGLISGAATADVQLPGSLHFGRIRAAGGGPLPPEVFVWGLHSGVIYSDTRTVSAPESGAGNGPRFIAANPLLVGSTIQLAGFPVEGPVRLKVVDVSGRTIRNLHGMITPSGQAAWRWDGNDESGARLRPGCYFVSAEGPQGLRVRRTLVSR